LYKKYILEYFLYILLLRTPLWQKSLLKNLHKKKKLKGKNQKQQQAALWKSGLSQECGQSISQVWLAKRKPSQIAYNSR